MSQQYTIDEVAKNNGKNGAATWLIIKNSVYDVTPFLSEHPGGEELVTEYAGKDATKAYNNAGHSSEANRILKKYKIGELIIKEKDANQEVKSKCPVIAYVQEAEKKTNEKRKKLKHKLLFCL